MTLYIFSALKTLRDIVPPAGLTGLVHDESAYTVSATIPMDLTVVPGEHIGFMCVDGRFRMFTVTKAENKDFDATTIITGIDTAVQELKETIVPELQQLDVNLYDSVVALLDASDARSSWSVTGSGPADLKKHRAYYTTMWTMLETLAQLYEWRIIPHYYFASGAITGRTIELAADTATFRGRILQSKKDASNVYVIKSTPPITRLYGLGPSKSQEPGVSENLTFAEAEWSTAAGDPANKPKEQTYVDDPAAVAKYGVRSSTVQFDEVEDEKDLLQKTWNHLQTIKEPTCTVEATVQDLEQVPGYETKIIRLGDLVPVRLSNAAMEEARVIGIKRDYVKPWLTKVTIGDKTASLSTQVTNLMTNALHTHETLTIYKNRFHEDEALIQLNAQFVQANAERIELNAQLIGLYATYTDELTGRITAAEIELDGMNATIDLWAGTLDEFGRRLDGAELLIDGLNHKITASVEDLDGKIAALELSLTDLEAKVVLKAEYDKDKNAMLTLISNAEESIATLKAEHGDRIAALELYTSDLESRVLLKAEYEKDKAAMLTLISNNEESIATLAAQHGDRLAALELYTSDMESRVLLKAEYEENRKADLQLIANAEESIATLEAEHDGRISSLELKTNDLESSVLLKAEYEENREADLKLISNAQESVATLETKYDDQIASLTLRADEQGSLIEAKADLILLEGYVKADELQVKTEAIIDGYLSARGDVDLGNVVADSVNTSYVSTDSLTADTVTTGLINGGTPATQEWILEQGFLTAEEGIDGSIATQEWVQNQGYATKDWVNNKDYVLTSSLPSILISYATKNWVTEQGYLTEIPSSYATQDWVTENFSKASATYKPTTIERYGTVSDNNIPVRTLNESGTVLLTGTVDAGDIYQSGYADAKPSSVSRVATYNSSSNAYNVTVAVKSADGTSKSFSLVSIDASAAYTAGEDSVTLSAGEWASNKMTVTASNGKTLEVDASSIYQSGASTGYTAGYQQAITGAMIELDGSTVKVYSPDGAIAGPTLDISEELDASYNSGYNTGMLNYKPTSASISATVSGASGYMITVALTNTYGNSVGTFSNLELDARDVYDNGYDDGYKAAVDSATFSVDGTNVVVTFSDGTTKTLDAKQYVTVSADVQYVSSTTTTMTVRGWGYAYFNDVYCVGASRSQTYDTAD